MRETGIIEKLLHTYGFIQCCDRQARLFFHYSQFTGNIDHLNIGDPVEFEMTYDRKTGKPIASSVVKIAPTVISFEVVNEERVTGTVTTEIKLNDESNSGSSASTQGRISYESRGECFFLPYTIEDIECGEPLKAGDKVTFQIATDKRSGNLHARNIQTEKSSKSERFQGVICSLKDTFGFIERADIVKEIFFHTSEIKGFKDLELGDDVEFSIQTRNGKEVAVNVIRLPEGTVVFEDIGEERIKGQVIKSLDRHQARHQSDPLPGRIRYRRDGVEIEIPYGDKDQMGEFTLMPKDWVQFCIATDRRDQLQRATSIELLEESFLVTEEVREKGLVVAVKEGFGFIKCQDREARMFFHFSELLDQAREVQFHDEVAFTVIQDPGTPGRQNAIRIKYLPQGTVKFETVSREVLIGVVEKEPESQFSRSPSKIKDENGKTKMAEAGVITYDNQGQKESITYCNTDCDPRHYPKVGDKVQFHVCESKCNGSKVALEVKVLGRGVKNGFKYTNQGFIAALKDGFGFIETAEHDREVFFHFSVFDGDAVHLDLGCEVEYSISQKNSKISAECVRKLAKGTIPVEDIKEETLEGVVIRPIRCFNPDQDEYPGLIRVGSEDGGDAEIYEFGITSLHDKREFLQKGDAVQFQVGVMKCSQKERAVFVKAIRKKLQATVEAIKGQFGFLSYEVEDGKKLFFHMSEVKDGINLQQGDKVEFVIIHNQRNGRYSACNVTKLSSDPRPEHMITRFRTLSTNDEGGPRLIVIRQPRGPDSTNGFRQPRERSDSLPPIKP